MTMSGLNHKMMTLFHVISCYILGLQKILTVSTHAQHAIYLCDLMTFDLLMNPDYLKSLPLFRASNSCYLVTLEVSFSGVSYSFLTSLTFCGMVPAVPGTG